MRHKYSVENLLHWFSRFSALHDQGFIVWKHFDEFQRAKVSEYNDHRPAGAMPRKAVGKTTYYAMKSLAAAGSPIDAELLKSFSDVTFFAMREYVLLNDPGLSLERFSNEFGLLPGLMAQLLDVSAGDKSAALAELPGAYLTYRPSLSRPGWVIVGYLEIKRSDDDLLTDEFTVYQGNPEEPITRQDFTGFIVYSHQYYLLVTSDSNSQFARIGILRCSEVSGGAIRKLDGMYCGASQRPGRAIVGSRLHLQKIDDPPSAKSKVGYKHVDSRKPSEFIDAGLWASLMAGNNSGVLDF